MTLPRIAPQPESAPQPRHPDTTRGEPLHQTWPRVPRLVRADTAVTMHIPLRHRPPAVCDIRLLPRLQDYQRYTIRPPRVRKPALPQV